jgi:uncharacterized protein YkwD
LLVLPAALTCAGILTAVAAVSNEPPVQRGVVRGAATTFGADLQILGLTEALYDGRVSAALHELDALRKLAALANWPQPLEPTTAEAAVAPAGTAPAPAAAPPPAATAEAWTDAAYAAVVLDAVNGSRAAAGLAPVAYDSRIASASSSYALQMITLDSFGHSVGGTTLASRLASAGFTEPVVLGEIIAWGDGTPPPALIVQRWMESPSHRSQILSADYRLAGAGCAFDGGVTHCVVNFAG